MFDACSFLPMVTTTHLYTHKVFAALESQLQAAVSALPTPPHLAVVLVGENPASLVYVEKKKTQICTIGGTADIHHLPQKTSQNELNALLTSLGEDTHVTGILLQLPLPSHLDTQQALACIPPIKDVDGLTATNQAYLTAKHPQALIPATPLGIMRILEWINQPLANTQIAVIGRSTLVGAPVAALLIQAGAEVDSYSLERPVEADSLKKADVIISAAGCAGLVTGSHLSEGCTVIDVGINPLESTGPKRKIVGDVDKKSVDGIAKYRTPVPGGVGLMTVASLLTNVVDSAYMQADMERPEWKIPTLAEAAPVKS